YSINANLDLLTLLNSNHTVIQAGEKVLFYSIGQNIFTVNILHKSIFTDTPVYSIYNFDSRIWAGTDGQIFELHLDKIIDSLKLPLDIPDLPISAIYVLENEIIAGTLGEGLFIIDRNSKII